MRTVIVDHVVSHIRSISHGLQAATLSQLRRRTAVSSSLASPAIRHRAGDAWGFPVLANEDVTEYSALAPTARAEVAAPEWSRSGTHIEMREQQK